MDEDSDQQVEVHRIDPESERRQIHRLRDARASRDQDVAERALSALVSAARDSAANLMPYIAGSL